MPKKFGRQQVSDEQIEAMRSMVKDGASHADIARTVGVSRVTVAHHFPGTGWSRQQIAEVSQATRRFNSVMKSNGVVQ